MNSEFLVLISRSLIKILNTRTPVLILAGHQINEFEKYDIIYLDTLLRIFKISIKNVSEFRSKP